MKSLTCLAAVLTTLALSAPSPAQRRKVSEEEFVLQPPAVGEVIPDVKIYDTRGKEVSTSSLRGHYAVLTFGCLT
jgi:hypothetical protein